MKRNFYIGAGFLALLIALGAGSSLLSTRAVVEAAGVAAPRFVVDPMWPKPLPNHWVIGSVIGVAADANHDLWILHPKGSLDLEESRAAPTPPDANSGAATP